MPMPTRVWALIDGFNWYYAIRDAIDDGLCGPRKKWLDYRAMADKLVSRDLNSSDHELAVRCYTAFVRNDQQAADRHRWYLRALEARGVVAVKGDYKRKTVRCRAACSRVFAAWEEKATDVNMAIDIVSGAAADEYDALYLFSGDSDLAPAIQRAKEICPTKNINVVVPAWRRRRGKPGGQLHSEFDKHADKLIRLDFADFGPELPEQVMLPNGKSARRPVPWR